MKSLIKLLKNKWVSRIGTIIIVLLVVYGMSKIVINGWDEIKTYEWRIDPLYMALSVIITMGAITLTTKVSHRLLKAFGYRINFWKYSYIYWLANMGRYAPGKVVQVVGMIVLLQREGIDKRVSFSVMTIYQGMFVLVSGITAILLVGPSFLNKVSPNFPVWVIIPIAICGIIVSLPKVLNKLLNIVMKILKRDEINYYLSMRDWAIVFIALIVTWLGVAAGFAFLVKALTPISFEQFPFVGGTFLAAYVLGWIVLIAPGGLGVREGIIVLLLSSMIPAGVAGIVSIASRIWMLIIEIILLAFFTAVYRIIFKKSLDSFTPDTETE